MLWFPEELVLKILSFLPFKSIISFGFVNKKARALSKDYILWIDFVSHSLPQNTRGNLSHELLFSGCDSWKELFFMWKRSKHKDIVHNYWNRSMDLTWVTAGIFAAVGTFFFPLAHSPSNSILQLCAIINEDMEMDERKLQVLKWMKMLEDNSVIEPHGYQYRFHETGIVYFEVTLVDCDTKVFLTGHPAVGIGLHLGDNWEREDGSFPGWSSSSVGYHSDDGKIFTSVSNGKMIIPLVIEFIELFVF